MKSNILILLAVVFLMAVFGGCTKWMPVDIETDPSVANVFIACEMPPNRKIYAGQILLPKNALGEGGIYAGKSPLTLYFSVPLNDWVNNSDSITIPCMDVKWVSGAERRISSKTVQLKKDGYRLMVLRPDELGLSEDIEKEKLKLKAERNQIELQGVEAQEEDIVDRAIKLKTLERLFQN